MDWVDVFALVALMATATAVGGAGARLGGTFGDMRVAVTALLVAALVLAVLLGTAWSLRRSSTTYW